MSLDNIQLSPIMVQDLFRNSLVDSNTGKPAAAAIPARENGFLGNNKKGVALLVNVAGCSYLPEDDLNFLLGILAACKLSMDDVALLNMANTPLEHSTLNEQVNPAKILLFGVTPASIQLPLHFPEYQVQSYNGQVFLVAPALDILKADKAEKMKLWTSLKTIFQIP